MELLSICIAFDGINIINQCMFSGEDKIRQKTTDESTVLPIVTMGRDDRTLEMLNEQLQCLSQ